MRRKRMLSWLLALALTVGLLVWPAPKAEAASDAYKGWVQTDSRWAWTVMGPPDRSYTALGYQAYTNQIPYVYFIGCTTTALAKIMVQAECADPATFDPGVLTRRLNAYGSDGLSGYVNYWQDGQASLWGSLRSFDRPAREVPNFKYVGAVWLTPADIVARSGRGQFMVLNVRNGGHWVAVDREVTAARGSATIMDTGDPGGGVYNVSLTARYPQTSYYAACYEHITHTYTTLAEEAHPHKEYKVCSCGSRTYTGAEHTLAACPLCENTACTASFDPETNRLELAIQDPKEDALYRFAAALYDPEGAFLRCKWAEPEAGETTASLELTQQELAETAYTKVMLLDQNDTPAGKYGVLRLNEDLWSGWSESCGRDEALYEIQERTLYRSRSVERTETLDEEMSGDPPAPEGEGWELVEQEEILSWQDGLTTTEKPVETNRLEITAETPRYYYHHWHNTYSGTNLNVDSIPHGTALQECSYTSDSKLTLVYNMADQGNKTPYLSNRYCGSSIANYRVWFENGSDILYTYRQAECEGLKLSWERCGPWSGWQADALEESETLEVETRTEYRWRLRVE